MQLCNCTVAIGGDPGMTVLKERVTVPELMVLRNVHGDDAVRNVEVIGETQFTAMEERERLNLIYRSPEGVVKETLGAVGSLPTEVSESGIPEDFIINAGTRGGKRKKSSATEALAVPADE